MCKTKVEELSKEICSGCKTRHKCDNECCIMSAVVAEWLIRKGYGNIKQFANDLYYNSVFSYNGNKSCEEQCDNLINQFDDTIKNFAKDYGITIEE